jgi:hypothetical protein
LELSFLRDRGSSGVARARMHSMHGRVQLSCLSPGNACEYVIAHLAPLSDPWFTGQHGVHWHSHVRLLASHIRGVRPSPDALQTTH